MKKYVHWLKVNGYVKSEDVAKQFYDIEKYLKTHESAKATIYQYDSGSFNWIVRLECTECYNDLDIDVNSFTTRLERLACKPKGIGREKSFEYPRSIQKYFDLKKEKSNGKDDKRAI